MTKKLLYGLAVITAMGGACISRQGVSGGSSSNGNKGQIEFSGGAGDSYQTAIILRGTQGMRKQEEAVAAEYDYISALYGKKDKEWTVKEQSTIKENDKTYDMVRVQIVTNGKMHFFYFDISYFIKTPRPPVTEEK